MLDLLTSPDAWASLATLTLLEIVLGIDNIIFISIITGDLPEHKQAAARRLGLLLALGMRIALLLGIVWIIGLTQPLFEVWGHSVSWRDVILLGGGLFLLAKGTTEIHGTVEGGHGEKKGATKSTMMSAVIQILLLDAVFSLDSVITAVGMADDVEVMIAAVVIAIGVMLFAAGPVGDFVSRHVTVKMLALAFLLLIGVTLIADGLGFHIPKGYLYFAVAFSVLVEALNLWARKNRRAKA